MIWILCMLLVFIGLAKGKKPSIIAVFLELKTNMLTEVGSRDRNWRTYSKSK